VDEVASIEDIAVADASAILLGEDDEEIRLASDRGLTHVAWSHASSAGE
jgi:hypothetical protein